MTMTPFGRSRTAIGIDVGNQSIRAAQLVCTGQDYHISALALLPRALPERDLSPSDITTLRRVLRRQGFSGRKVVLADHGTDLLRGVLELPSKVSGAPAARIARMELSRMHNVAPESFEIAYWPLREINQSRPVTPTLALGYPHAAGEALVDLFESSGFNVTALDVRTAASARACRPLLLPSPAITAIVDLGWGSTSLLLICGQTPVYERPLESVSLEGVAGSLAERCGLSRESAGQVVNLVAYAAHESTTPVDDETCRVVHKHLQSYVDKLVEELRVPLSYAHRQFPGNGIQRMLLIGVGAGMRLMSDRVAKALGIDTKVVSPCDLAESPVELAGKAANPVITVAVGLARFEGTRP